MEYIIVFLYLGLNLLIGIYSGYKIKEAAEWSLGQRNFNRWIIFITLFASFTGGGFTIGLSEKVFVYGIVFIFAMWGFSLKEIWIAKFIVPKMREFITKAITAGDIMEQGFGSKAKIITGIASIMVCGGIIGAQLTACGNILNIFLNIPTIKGTLIIASLVLIYTTIGGLKSVINLDKLHFTMIVIMLPLTAIFAVIDIGGISVLLDKIPANHLTFFGNFTLLQFLILFVSFFLGETLIPPYIQRLLIGKNIDETQKGTLFAGLLSLPFFFIIGVIGLCAVIIDPNLTPNLSLPFVINYTLPPILKGLAIAALVAVVLSSCNSFINSTSIAVYHDIVKLIIDEKLLLNKELQYSRIITIIIGAVATIFSVLSESALNILLYAYQFWTPMILMPLLLSIYGFKSNDKTFITACVLSSVSVIITNIFGYKIIDVDGGLLPVIIGMVVNSITIMVIHFYIRLQRE